MNHAAISLFAGPGGMDHAAESLGIRTLGIEWDANACQTRRAAGLATIQADVRQYGRFVDPESTILMGGPPCQTFTLTGNGAGREALDDVLALAGYMDLGMDVSGMLASLSDERTALVLEPLRWALEAHRMGRPYRTIVLEQVPTVLPVWQKFVQILTRYGYSATAGVLNAEEYGVPQTRKRAFLVASLDRKAALPEPTNLRYKKGWTNDCKPMSSVVDRGEPYIMVSNYGTGGDASKRGRRDWSEPAFTVTGKISRNRIVSHDGRELDRLSHGEAGALQSFPLDYPWSGKDIPQQIGNAAPPKLVKAVLGAALGL